MGGKIQTMRAEAATHGTSSLTQQIAVVDSLLPGDNAGWETLKMIRRRIGSLVMKMLFAVAIEVVSALAVGLFAALL